MREKKKGRAARIALLFAGIWMLIGLVMAQQKRQEALDTKEAERVQSSKQVEKEVWKYQSAANEDGITTDTPDPYFVSEQTGFFYRQPEEITYYSGVTGTGRHALVFLPADYDETKEYPVLYLLHGLGGSHRTWRNKSAHTILQNLYYFEDVPEMIVVCPNSNVNQKEETEGLSFSEKMDAFDLTVPDLVEYLMPYMEEQYPVKSGREHTAVAGNSMGGRNALYAAFTYPEKFGYVGAFSSSLVVSDENYKGRMQPLLDDLKLPGNAEDFYLLMLAVGKEDDVCGSVTYQLHDLLNASGIRHVFYDREGGHQNVVWQNALYNFAKKLFVQQEAVS